MKKQDKTKIEFMNDCLLIDNGILVLSDLHLGYEDVLVGRGIFPRIQLKDILNKLNNIFWDLNLRGIKLKQIVICGDLKHEFGEISDSEWRETIKLLDFLLEKVNEIILIKGNHDNILGPIVSKREVKLKDYYKIRDICFLHGDKLEERWVKDSKILILGHLHPAVSISDEYKREKYKCFLKGKWKRKQVYVLPSFSEISNGYDLTRIDDEGIEKRKREVRREFFIIDDKKLKNFEVIIFNNKEGKSYNFKKLKSLI